jgi:hypothetical protein
MGLESGHGRGEYRNANTLHDNLFTVGPSIFVAHNSVVALNKCLHHIAGPNVDVDRLLESVVDRHPNGALLGRRSTLPRLFTDLPIYGSSSLPVDIGLTVGDLHMVQAPLNVARENLSKLLSQVDASWHEHMRKLADLTHERVKMSLESPGLVASVCLTKFRNHLIRIDQSDHLAHIFGVCRSFGDDGQKGVDVIARFVSSMSDAVSTIQVLASINIAHAQINSIDDERLHKTLHDFITELANLYYCTPPTLTSDHPSRLTIRL